jgi:hypothetical protein
LGYDLALVALVYLVVMIFDLDQWTFCFHLGLTRE